MTGQETAAELWEARYAGAGPVWSGHVNPVLADVASSLTPGSALDLGCGEGGDAVWLAERGWTVTGVDLSPTAVDRGRAAAAAHGIPDDRLRFVVADLATWTTGERYDLVTASFLHSWFAQDPRDDILRRATGLVGGGGRLLVVAHAAAPPWADHHAEGHSFPTPAGDLDTLALDPGGWEVLLAETRERSATGPDGRLATLVDSVVLVRRAGAAAA